jgi:hypothetical protein
LRELAAEEFDIKVARDKDERAQREQTRDYFPYRGEAGWPSRV